MLIISGLVGPKARPFGVVDGQQVNIPVLLIIRPKLSAFCARKVVLMKVEMDIWLRTRLV